MVKPRKRTIGGIIILLMLFASPLSVSYSFAESQESQEEKVKISKNVKKERLWAILTEKVVDGKLELQHYALPTDVSEEDMKRLLSFEDQTSSWIYVNYKAYNSGIVLFDGKASKVEENLWEITANGVLNLEEKEFDLELSGKSNGSHVIMHGTASDEDLSYRVIFSGKIAETDEENVFAISFVISGLKNPETEQNFKLLQIGELSTNSEKSSGFNQEFRNSISMR
ncbi:hypothetical protein [Nitrosopumilus ureiphilus]|uniref:Uncharacterized protein n=1 Tax=Nitrosopumilus ureiphilus TaxID=1470067 RepID=A0A7D5R546_9ARCH|nr:hypothetical protein [Nitrosopumilus ureiphilus]QLH05678.1 hypothetical protein C5F50_00160 [Nitrosopumilus ureiphilus]